MFKYLKQLYKEIKWLIAVVLALGLLLVVAAGYLFFVIIGIAALWLIDMLER